MTAPATIIATTCAPWVPSSTPPAATDGPATARSFILVTPDGERTMNTYLGACQGLSTADVEAEKVRAAAITYLEGYLWDPQDAKDAFRKAVELAHGAGNRVALTLSDSFCVDRFRDEFLGLMREGHIDILFANIHELKALYQTADDDTALAALRDENLPHDHFIGAITRSEEGAARGDAAIDPERQGTSGRSRRRHHRRRRPLRRRLPLGPDQRGSTTSPARGWAAWRLPRSSRISARARKPISPTWHARTA